MQKEFSNMGSLLEALAEAMNLIQPEIVNHHQQTAYLTYALCREMGMNQDLCDLGVYAALLHDVGAVIFPTGATLEEVESQARTVSAVGSRMLGDLDGFRLVGQIVNLTQCSWEEAKGRAQRLPLGEREEPPMEKEAPSGKDPACLLPGGRLIGCLLEKVTPLKLAAVVSLSDTVSVMLNPQVPVLNQRREILSLLRQGRGRLFWDEVVDAFERISEREYIWLDLLCHPDFKSCFSGKGRAVGLKQCLAFTKLISRMIDYRSPFTAMHSAGVSASSKKLALLAGMGKEDLIKMEIAGNLHDVGKLKVPAQILEKPGKLTEEEFNVVKEHPYHTRLILSRVEGFEEIVEWAANHHEKLNGKGYPYHLAGEDLDEGARIMAVADIFSAITEERPYRKGMEKDAALSVLWENARRGDISKDVVLLLADHYEEVNRERDRVSRIEGRHYFRSIKGKEEDL